MQNIAVVRSFPVFFIFLAASQPLTRVSQQTWLRCIKSGRHAFMWRESWFSTGDLEHETCWAQFFNRHFDLEKCLPFFRVFFFFFDLSFCNFPQKWFDFWPQFDLTSSLMRFVQNWQTHRGKQCQFYPRKRMIKLQIKKIFVQAE